MLSAGSPPTPPREVVGRSLGGRFQRGVELLMWTRGSPSRSRVKARVEGGAVRYGLDIPTADEYADVRLLADLAVDAEEAGWDGFFVWDTIYAEGRQDVSVVDPWITLAAIALRTQRIRIGAMLTPLARRRLWQVARQVATLDHLAVGRVIFGAGLGFQAIDFTPFGEDFDPKHRAERLDEGLAILEGLWTGEPFSFEGKHYHLDHALLLPRPLQAPGVPIWTAVGWPHRTPLQRAARYDGVYVMAQNQETDQPLTPAETREILAYVHTLRDDTKPFDVAVNGVTTGAAERDVATVRPYAEAGATWWLEYDATGHYTDYRERIRRGPPPAC
jgi:alkanesulfonate monooxygenase SsuD/methylene tetrahydromethanopterin reductase-like flavin-dependent oxidoreductase (luciferase family)